MDVRVVDGANAVAAELQATRVDPNKPLIVGIGGAVGGTSSTEHALRAALRAAEDSGARTRLFGGDAIASLPFYNPKNRNRSAEELAFVQAVRDAHGLIIASPGYHGGISGVIKNALDLIEETARDEARVYLTDMPVGIIATAYGWQATGSTIAALRSIVHAFRAWPTPYAAAVNTSQSGFDPLTGESSLEVVQQLTMVGRQVAQAALAWGNASVGKRGANAS